MSLDPKSFRKALGSFASGVTVVTSLDGGPASPVGVTVSAFSSLSLDPPLVLFCLGNGTSSLAAFKACGHFAVNVLAESQRDLSQRFAGKGDDKWQGVVWTPGAEGMPLLAGCLANLECATESILDGGDHRIFVGRVLRIRCQDGGNPLYYFRGNYLNQPADQ